MKNLRLKIILSFFLLQPNFLVGQEIDPALLENLSPEQIQALRERYETDVVSERPKPSVTESTILKEFDEEEDQSTELKKYGYNFFQSTPSTVFAVGDLPLPNDYKISLSDQFTVILSGSKEAIFDLDVNLDGTILFPELGSISVVGESFLDVKKKLKNFVEQSYIGVQIDLSIKNLAAKKITIVGAVEKPGTYLVNPFSTISSALNYSGGILEIGTLRNIKLLRNDGSIYFFDLYKLLIKGDRSNDITIQAGDVILVDSASQFITLDGEVNRPAIYEVIKDETLFDLIGYGLGFTNIANKTSLSLSVLNLKNNSIEGVTGTSLEKGLKNILSVNVNPYINKNISNIEVIGAVKEPGFYSLNSYKNLEELIDNLEFVDVYPWLGVLEQFDDERLISSTVLFSLNDESTYKSVNLLPNSRVYFANQDKQRFDVFDVSESILNKIADYELTLNHDKEIYKLPVYGLFKLQSLVEFLGLDMENTDGTVTYVSPTDDLVIKDNYKNIKVKSRKNQSVTFRTQASDIVNVNISGAIEFPGEYSLNPGATLQDLYDIVGSFKDNAFINGIIFTRNSVRDRQIKAIESAQAYIQEQILLYGDQDNQINNLMRLDVSQNEIDTQYLGRVSGEFKPGSDITKNMILVEGDTIFIPRRPSTISIFGEVHNEITFSLKKIGIQEAIEKAGGFKKTADKKAVYIIKANGEVTRANKSIFVQRYKLEPGDTIIVPRKNISRNPLSDTIAPFTQILSDLSFAAAAIESLSNN